ncbi:VOC family protein [Subtercola sp. YIM 133946]|uniref:VOC family protein n=1 Tax=Subtercola sp. YIM 133946 TaxID=3118909 RepID=UPI002F93EECD
MSIVEKYEQGVPCWADVITSDANGAMAFYGALFGWQFDAYPMGPEGSGLTYYMATLHGKNVVGLMQRFDDAPTSWNTYIAVDDADAAVARGVSAGGTIDVAVDEIPGSGRTGRLIDPAGAPISVWQAIGHIGSAVVNEHGAVVWSELHVADVPSVLPFYEATFGVGSETAPMGDAGDYTQLQAGGRSVAGIMQVPETAPDAAPAWFVHFAVDDPDATVALATSLGASVAEPLVDMAGVGRFAALTDPQGGTFFIING